MKPLVLLASLLISGAARTEPGQAGGHNCAQGEDGDVIGRITVCDEYSVRKIVPSDAAGLCLFYNTALGEDSRRNFHPLGQHADDARCRSIASWNATGATRDEERMDLVVIYTPGRADSRNCTRARSHSRIVGWAFWYGSSWSPLLGIALADSHQARGLGTQAMRLLIRTAAEQQVHELRLNVLASNRRAKQMYLRLGFEVIAEGHDRDVDAPMLSMRLDLDSVRHSLFPHQQLLDVSSLHDGSSMSQSQQPHDAQHGDNHPPVVISSPHVSLVRDAGSEAGRQGVFQLRSFFLGLVPGFSYQVMLDVLLQGAPPPHNTVVHRGVCLRKSHA